MLKASKFKDIYTTLKQTHFMWICIIQSWTMEGLKHRKVYNWCGGVSGYESHFAKMLI